MSPTFTSSAAVFVGAGIEPTVAMVSSARTNASHAPWSVETTNPSVPAASSSAIITPSWPRRRVNATSSWRPRIRGLIVVKVSRRSWSVRSAISVVVWLAGEDLMAAVELLEQHDAGELVGQRERAEREAVVDAVELEAQRPADDKADVTAGLAAGLQEAAEAQRVELLALAMQQRDERALGDSRGHLLLLADLDRLDPRLAREDLVVVVDVVVVRGAQPPDGEVDQAHAAILGRDG